MQVRTTVFLLILTLALGGYLLFVDRHKPTTDESKQLSKRIFLWNSEDVMRFRIYKDYWTDIVCERLDDSSWQMTKPYETKANQSVVYKMLSTLEFAEHINRISMDEETILHLQQYGLQYPGLSLTIETPGRSQTLLLGDETPLKDGLYALLKADDEKLLVVPKSIADILDQDTESWVEVETSTQATDY